MLLLIAADTHDTLSENNIPEYLLSESIDAVFTLGDVSQRDIMILKSKFSVPFFGVGGNHDSWDSLKMSGVEDLHTRTITWKTLTIGGFGGSLRYKDTPHYMFFTEDEASRLLAEMPRCDILLTHAAPKYKEKDIVEVPKEKEKESLWSNLKALFIKSTPNPYANHSIDTSAPQYRGLYGIGEYIHKKKPNFVLHGHIHESDTSWNDQTCIRGFYGLELFELQI